MSRKNPITRKSTPERRNGLGHAKSTFLSGMWIRIFLILSLTTFSALLWASADETSGQASKSLEIPLGGEGLPNTLTFPLYEQNNIRYFSAGLGKEERGLSYPPYPLKLIFVKGESAYLTSVAVDVFQPDGTKLLSIPDEEVEGPWLFLNLPTGKYMIKATDSSGTTQEKSITLTDGGTTTMYFRWP